MRQIGIEARAEVMDIVEMGYDYTRVVLCIFNKRAVRKWAGNWEVPGWVGDEQA